MTLIDQCKKLKEAAKRLAYASGQDKNEVLSKLMNQLEQQTAYILEENRKDLLAAREAGMKESLIDRLALNEGRIRGMIEALDTVRAFPDPIWSSQQLWTTEDGLVISKMTVPLGVIGIIYESRPNVTVDAFSLALKSGNGILLRGSSSALRSNRALVEIIRRALADSKISPEVVQLIEDTDYGIIDQMIRLNEYLDVIIPRGGANLIQRVVQNATVPTIQTGVGNCHIFVDESADIEDTLSIVDNAKIQRPGTCNSLETLLVHAAIADRLLPRLAERLADRVELRTCERSFALVPGAVAADEEDWATEYLDLILAIRIVNSLEEAMDHIDRFGSHHSEAILTKDINHAQIFQRQVDAAAVYVNASTRFTDGGVFGFGGEMGISTQKIHVRGPVGINDLVSCKYTVLGKGQTRP